MLVPQLCATPDRCGRPAAVRESQVISTTMQKLASLIRMLGSPNDSEVIATARAIQRVLKSAGSDFNDLAEGLTHSEAENRREAVTTEFVDTLRKMARK